MKRLDLSFLSLAAVSLVAGVTMGVVMGATHDFALMPVHAHLNLLGWVSLALFGLVHRAYPELGERRLAKLQFALAAPSALLLPAGIAVAILTEQPSVAIGASLIWFGACVLFLVQIVQLMLASRTAAAPKAERKPATV